MLHKAVKPEELVGSYKPLSLTSHLGKLLEKAVPDNLSDWANNRMDLGNITQMAICLTFQNN